MLKDTADLGYFWTNQNNNKMKKLFLTVIAGLGFTMLASAQSTDKGTVVLGGNVSYNYEKVVDLDGNQQSYSILPNIGYFVKDNFALGLGLGYAGISQENAADRKSIAGGFIVSPYARYYKGDGPVKFFGQLSVPMAWANSKIDGNKVGTSENYGATVSPGIAFFPTEKIGVELSVRGLYYEYSSIKHENGSKVGTNTFGLNADSFAPSLGVKFHF